MLLDVKYRITNTVAPIKRTKRLNIKATETEWIKKNAYTNWNWPIFPLYLYHQKCIDIEFSIDLMYFDFDDLKFSFFCGKTRITFVYTGRLRMFTKWRWRKKMLCTSFFLFFCKWFQYTKKKIWNVSMQISQKPISFLSLYLLPWKLIVRTASIVATATEYSVITTTKLDNS